MSKLIGKSIVITGSTRGLGRAMAKAFLAEGARVMICGRSASSTEDAVSRLRSESSAGDRLQGAACDTGDFDQVARLSEQAIEHFGAIHVWINNAAVSGPYGPIETIPRQDFETVVRSNILGCYYGSLVALRHMLPRRAGKIINIAGLGADGRPAPSQSPYSSSKAWVQSFTKTIAGEHKHSGVGIFVLNPGMMLTDMVTKVEATTEEGCAQLERLPTVLRILAQPPEIPAARAVWLASSATDGRTGLVVKVLTPLKMTSLLMRELGRRVSGRTKDVPPVEIIRPS